MLNNKKKSGFISIYFAIFFLILISIITDIMFNSITQTAAMVDNTIMSVRNSYCAEAGIAVGKWYAVNKAGVGCPALDLPCARPPLRPGGA